MQRNFSSKTGRFGTSNAKKFFGLGGCSAPPQTPPLALRARVRTLHARIHEFEGRAGIEINPDMSQKRVTADTLPLTPPPGRRDARPDRRAAGTDRA